MMRDDVILVHELNDVLCLYNSWNESECGWFVGKKKSERAI